ncbi:MAG: UDP-N-acetylglucosamine diphosphorylase [Puniceicoccales bacterium]|jgi:NDP-sugar pyrophosphorylase family protein|nr:UDP-N-acetylglucosamine diphosphorylase [Puniceicoccales bacterium]
MKVPAKRFFSLPDGELFSKFFLADEPPVQWLDKIPQAIMFLATSGEVLATFPKNCDIGSNVFIHKSAKLPSMCVIRGPCYIGRETEIRPFAYIRENCVIGERCLVGNSTEIKNSILLNGVQVPHFNYIGDSILGNHAHLGAGAILANLRLDGKSIKIFDGEERFDTERRKFGAILGDYAEVGCNSVLNPGAVLARGSKIAPNTNLSGFIEENSFIGSRDKHSTHAPA